MTSEREQKRIPNWQRQAWLTEYQACHHDNSSSSLSYWTLTGIFIGFSSVLLGGLIYGIFSSDNLFKALLNVITQQEKVGHIEEKQVFATALITLLISVITLIILYLLKRWLKRVQFLAGCNFNRMREIELELGMQKGLRIQGIDDWGKLKKAERERLEQLHLEDWCKEQKKSYRYEPPSRKLMKGIFRTLLSLWSILFVFSLVLIITACLN